MDLFQKTDKLAVGLMSGTSLDGVDAALVQISGSGKQTRVELAGSYELAYDRDFKNRLKNLCDLETSNVKTICEMNVLLGEKFAEAIFELLKCSHKAIEEIDFIASHGQTVYHIPPGDTGDIPSTLQIGDLSVIAQRTGKPVIGDFRPADIAAGGQGAPLVPYADFVLFGNQRKGIAVQNIGGIGNVTFLPSEGTLEDVMAYDTGPGNMVIDQIVEMVTAGRLTYDHNGEMASCGNVDESLIQKWLSDPYFSEKPPKSTGREKFGKSYAEKLIKDAAHLGTNDLVATVTMLTARSIADSYRRFIPSKYRMDEVILGGGGSKNHTLVDMMKELLPGVNVTTHEAFGLDSDFKEAMAFVILANEFIHHKPNNVPSATGANRSVTMGKLALP